MTDLDQSAVLPSERLPLQYEPPTLHPWLALPAAYSARSSSIEIHEISAPRGKRRASGVEVDPNVDSFSKCPPSVGSRSRLSRPCQFVNLSFTKDELDLPVKVNGSQRCSSPRAPGCSARTTGLQLHPRRPPPFAACLLCMSRTHTVESLRITTNPSVKTSSSCVLIWRQLDRTGCTRASARFDRPAARATEDSCRKQTLKQQPRLW